MNQWDRAAQSVYLSRATFKAFAYRIVYGGTIDPWMDYLIQKAIEEHFQWKSENTERK